jgi:hypothetical protein
VKGPWRGKKGSKVAVEKIENSLQQLIKKNFVQLLQKNLLVMFGVILLRGTNIQFTQVQFY